MNQRGINSKIIVTIGLLLFLVIFSELLKPWILDFYSRNWSEFAGEQQNEIEIKASEYFDDLQNEIINRLNLLKVKIKNADFSNENLVDIIAGKEFEGYEIIVFNNDSDLVAWSSPNYQDESFLFEPVYNNGECFFYEANLYTFLTIYDSLDDLTFYVSRLVEKEYKLENEYFDLLSLSIELSDLTNTNIDIEYTATNQFSRDGRYFTFPVYNKLNNAIANVRAEKPSRYDYLREIANSTRTIQFVLLLIITILLGILIYTNSENIKSKRIKFFIAVIYLIFIRIVLYLYDIPARFNSLQINNPEYFSSEFGFGLVKSPLEFFITSVFILLIVLYTLKYFRTFLASLNDFHNGKLWLFISSILLLMVFILLLRGFGATIRSIVFETTLRYFKYPSLLPDLSTLLMDLNILIIGFVTISVLIMITATSIIITRRLLHKQDIFLIPVIFLIFQFAALIFDMVQKQPQGTPLLRVLSIFIIFVFSIYYTKFRAESVAYFILLLFTSSLITISYLTYYNSDYERKSLKTTAYELIKPNEEYILQLVNRILQDEKAETKLQFTLESDSKVNFNSIAFQVWSNNGLEKETFGSIINIISNSRNLLGKYSYQFDESFIWDWQDDPDTSLNGIRIRTIYTDDDNKIIRGLKPIIKKKNLLGYIEVSILIDRYKLGIEDNPDFFSSSKTLEKSPVNLKQLRIFDFQNRELVNYYTDLIPSQNEIHDMVNVEFNENSEAWLSIPLNGIEHIIYLKKVKDIKKDRIIAIALAEKDLSWNLFDFFKIFLIHSLYILAALIVGYFFYYKKFFNPRYSFRTQLLLSFILISTLPLLLLALYFKNLTDEKNTAAIYYKLGKRADHVEVYLKDYLENNVQPDDKLLIRATNDLGINYDLFKDNYLFYSSNSVYYEIGLIPKTLNASVFNELELSGLTEYVVRENIEKYFFHSFYHKAELNNEEYLIKVSDAFNSIQLPMSGTEVDIFLFGSYSLAIILVIIFSTILANQISSPIRKLTNATLSVAEGNLKLKIDESARGEVGELIEGFNFMVAELEKNQSRLAEMERESAWRDMARQVAHEIKNPLTPMKLAVQQLITAKQDNSSKFEDTFNKVTSTIIRQIEILKNIASEFSNFAKMPELNIKKINLINSVKDTLNLFVDDNIKIKFESKSDEYIIKADNQQLQRTFFNLIKNSIQASSTEISINLSSDLNNVYMRLIDNGKGIPENIINKVFEANFTTKVEGMGLGLHMAKRLFDSIDASIEVERTGSNGTVLLITFPVALK
ncbi:MAG: HAMP domain-containing protein [Melioribacteraceae bacterium]|nr:HAMP domain-containing protein [Melioribacteraceae bacterium]